MFSNKRKNQAVSEVLGTILLLTISVSLFSVVYISVFSIHPSSPQPSSNIVGFIERNKNGFNNIIFEHRSGDPLSLDTKILLNIGGNIKEITVEQFLEDANGDGFWNIGERLVYNVTDTDLDSLQTEATIVDMRSNTVVMQGILSEGVTLENPYIITKPAEYVGSHSAKLCMNYNFKNYSGYLRFIIKESNGDWSSVGESPKSGWGSYNWTIDVLIPNKIYYFKAQLEYDTHIIEGKVLPIYTFGTIVGEWHLNSDSGITAFDSSGHDNNGTLYNKPQWTTDKINGSNALCFDGIDDYVLVNDDDSLDILDNITIEAWVKPLEHSDGFFGDIANQPIDISDFGILNCLEPDFIKINDNIYAVVCRGTNNHGFLLTVEVSNSGQINDKIIDILDFDTLCYDPNIIQIDSTNFYVIVYKGPDSDGWLKTVQIESNGQITNNVFSSKEFDTVYCGDPYIIHVANLVYAVAYTNNNLDGCLKTIEITNDGQINNVIATSIFDETDEYSVEEFDIIHLNENKYVISYRNKDKDGELRTVSIENNGLITSPYHNINPKGYYINSFLFDRDDGWTPDIIHIYDNIFAIAYGGFQSPYTDGWLKTIEISYDGTYFEIIDEFEFNTNYGTELNIIHIDGSIYAIAYTGYYNSNYYNGFLITVEITNNGLITKSCIDTLRFDTSYGYDPEIINVDGSVYAIVYTGPDSDGFLKTVEITNNGLISDNIIDDLELGIFDYREQNIIHVSDNIYAMVYRGLYNDGYIRTLEINNNGQIIKDTIDIFEFETQNCFEPNIINVDGSVYAIVYTGPDSDGFLKTVSIMSDGQITDSVVDFLEFDISDGYESNIIFVYNDIYAIAYNGSSGKGILKTVEISNNGLITDDVIDSLCFDDVRGYDPEIIHISDDIFVIAYNGTNGKGILKTVEISNNGLITDDVIDSLYFDDARGYDPEIIRIFNDIYAIAYTGPDNDGFLKTVNITSDGQITDSVIDILEFSTSDAYVPEIIHINDRIVAIVYQGLNGGYLSTLRIGENGDITDLNDETLKYDDYGYEPNIISINGDIYAITCRWSNFDGYVKTYEIKETQKVRRVIAKEGAYTIYANSTTVFAYINNKELKAPIYPGFNYVVLTYDKNAGPYNMKLYVNALEIINTTYSQNININNLPLFFGGFNCIIDEIIIHEVSITKDEITQRYNDFTT
jgi:FlaG/FlaF family flagellin (archaellin)